VAKRDFYAVLEVSRSASADEIKKSFRKLAMKFHPDRNPGDKKAEDRFKELTEAYEILSDAKKREMYDQFGFAGAGAGPGGNPGQGFGGGFQSGGFNDNEQFQDIFGDLFGDVFGGARGAPRGTRRQRGADLRYTLNVTFEEAATGTEKTISFMRQRSGRDDTARLSVKVPAGVSQGQRLKLANEGDGSPNGGAAGDLYVIVNTQEHPLFKREEDDVVLDVPIPFTEAVLGTTLEIPTLTNKVALKVPPGVHSGQTFRLKGKGFPKIGGMGTGDMLIRLVVDTPANLSSQQRQQLLELSQGLTETPLVKAFREKVSALSRQRKP